MADKKYSVDDILRIFSKLDKKIEDLSCFVKECCAKIPVNIGTGIGLFKKLNQNKWEFKSLLPGNNISITQTNNEIVISSTTEPVDCQDIKDCLGISDLGDPNKYLNEQGDFITISGGGFTCNDLNSCDTDNLPEGVTNLYFTNARAIAALSGTPTEILYYNSLGDVTSDSEFYRTLSAPTPHTFFKSTAIAPNTAYSEMYLGSDDLRIYNDTTGMGDGGLLNLNFTAKLGKVTAGSFDSYLEVNTSGFKYVGSAATLFYPSLDGNNGDVLTTDGAGNLTFQPTSGGGLITAIADTNTVDLTETVGTLTADVNYQNTATINLSEDASGLKADFASMNVSQFTNDSNYVDGTGSSNEIAYFVDSNTIDSLDVATYPSLTELSYVKGVTSAIQTQLDSKLDILTVQVFM